MKHKIYTLLFVLSMFYGSAQIKQSITDSIIINDTTEKIYQSKEVDKTAQYENGDIGVLKFIASNFNLPKDAYENRFTGNLIISFIVEKKGELTQIKIINNNYSSINSEAIRVISLLQKKWRPAIKNGNPVRSEVKIPLKIN
jgi:Gram-negative bacterial TonB protein C-terminal